MLEPIADIIHTYLGGAGKIRCGRCTATSKRSRQQCGKPALKISRTQKCQFHGGRSTGPRTAEGKSRVIVAHWKHGQETLAAKTERAKSSTLFLQLEDATHVLGMITGGRTRGRKPVGYIPVATLEGVVELVLRDAAGPTAS